MDITGMNIIDIAIKRLVTVVIGALALVMFGLLAYFSLPVSLLPDVRTAVVTVQTMYPGAGYPRVTGTGRADRTALTVGTGPYERQRQYEGGKKRTGI
jgi:hypothetical protein